MTEEVTDRYGHRIYLTDERWEHIISEHPEMIGYDGELLETLKTGRRKQEARDLKRYRYMRSFQNLNPGNNSIVVVVKFDFFENRVSNNFVLTAYQQFIHSLQR